jgi:predicted DNA-binding protein (MmcQ/YjbR family)
MTPEELHAACLALNGAEETFPFNPETSVFKVEGKVFALSALDADPLRVSLKCEPELAIRLREEYEAVTPGWHLNKKHWNTVLLDGSVPDKLLREMIEDSYDLVVAKLPRARQIRLDWPGAAGAGVDREPH